MTSLRVFILGLHGPYPESINIGPNIIDDDSDMMNSNTRERFREFCNEQHR